MRITIDTVSTDILKLGLLFQCLSTVLEEVDLGKFAIKEHRYAYLHGMDSVLHHRRPLNLFAAMGMIYIYRLNLVKQRISTEPDQNICHTRGAPHPNERRNSSLLRLIVHGQKLLSGIEIIADINVVYSGFYHRLQYGRPVLVERPDTVQDNR